MQKYLIIKADTNDADYVTSENKITDEEIEIIKPVLKAIEDFEQENPYVWYNFPKGDFSGDTKTIEEIYKDKVSSEALEMFEDMCPHGIHSIHSVKVITVIHEEKLL